MQQRYMQLCPSAPAERLDLPCVRLGLRERERKRKRERERERESASAATICAAFQLYPSTPAVLVKLSLCAAAAVLCSPPLCASARERETER